MRFLAGFITAICLASLVFIGGWLYFDLPIQTNDNTTQQTSNETSYNTSQHTQQLHNDYTPPKQDMSDNEVQPERLPNLHDKQKALQLMERERNSLSDEDKKIFDGVIETAKTNINNNVGTQEDYNILNTYKKIEKGE